MKITQFGKKQLWRVLTVVLAFFLVMTCVAMAIMTEYVITINGALGITNTITVKVGEGEEVDPIYYKSQYSTLDELYKAQSALSEKLEAEGAVLLENNAYDTAGNKALPLNKGAKVSLFSRSSVDVGYGGTGSGSVNADAAVDMKTAFEEDGKMFVNNTLWTAYKNYETPQPSRVASAPDFSGATFYLLEAPMSIYTQDVTNSYAQYGDAAIVTLTRVGGEGADLVPGEFGDGTDYLTLQDVEKDMLRHVSANFDRVIVLINSSNAMEIGELADYGVDAVLWIGGVGQEGLRAVADILVGDVNPSGRLVDTYATDSMSSPAMQNFGDFTFSNTSELDAALQAEYGASSAAQYNKYLVYQEGIYVGYRYYETRYEDVILGNGNAGGTAGTFASESGWDYSDEVIYPFGYGISYTTFTQSLNADSVTDNGETITMTVSVTNTGSKAGRCVVQVYGQAPYTGFDKQNGIEKSAVQLVGFAKTETIEPEGTKTVTVTVNKYDLATYDHVVNKGYILEAGDYYLSVGDNAHDALNNILAKKGASGLENADGTAATGNTNNVWTWKQATDDTTTYKYSDSTKNRITNLFDDVDINYYKDNVNDDDLVRYTTRSDWQTTFPQTVANLAATDKMIDALHFTYVASGNTDTTGYKTEQDNGLVLASMIGVDYNASQWQDLLDQLSVDDMMTIVARACKAQVESVSKPLNYLKDGPASITGNASSGGGLYYDSPVGYSMLTNPDDRPTDTPAMAYPTETVIASTWDVELVEDLGEAFGEDGLWTLVHHHYSPGANIHRTPYSGRNFEYYSEDGFLSGIMAAYEVKGEVSKGMITYIKHFVLNDQETNRTGVSTFVTEQAFREIYLRGFEYAFTMFDSVNGSTNAVMGAFNRIGCTWTGAHTGLMTDLLGGEWGFNGLVDTDFALFNHMEARSGVMAGTTVFAVTSDARANELLKTLKTDADLYAKVREACHRNLYVIANSAEMNGLTSDMRIVTVLTPYQIALIVAIVVFGVAFAGSAAMLVLQTYFGTKKEEKSNV